MIAGNILMAGAIAAALSMHDAVGGTSGLSVILSRYIPLPQTFLLFLINGLLFVAGWIFMGFSFALKSAGSVILFPVLLGIMKKGSWTLFHLMNPIASAVVAGMMLGASAALIIDSGASTGGFDIPGIILQKKTGVTPSVLMCIGDVVVILGTSGLSRQSVYGLIIASVCAVVNTVLLNLFSKRHAIAHGMSSHHQLYRDA